MSSPELTTRLHRSYLYAPGADPDVMRKALRAGADAVVLDLEDAVAADQKQPARDHLVAVLDELASTGDQSDARRPDVHVRINRDGQGYSRLDLDAAVRKGLDAIRLPKVESADAVRDVAAALSAFESSRGLASGTVRLYLTVESARGLVNLAETLGASDRIERAALGSSDLLADLGASGDDDLATIYARSQLVVVSRASGVGPPIDSVHTDLHDEAGLRSAARRARVLGFRGKSLIHPRQIAVAHEVFTPTAEEIAQALNVIETFETATASGRAVTAVDGAFVDPAVVARARAILDLRSTE